jgi:uncharacterized protein (DUF1778 family)
MRIKVKNDHPIFFRLPSLSVDQIDEAAYDLRTSRTEFIRQAIFRALDGLRQRRDTTLPR